MALALDPTFAQILSMQEEVMAASGMTFPDRDDALGLREMLHLGFPMAHAQADAAPDVYHCNYETTAGDGTTITLRWYTKNGVGPGSAVVYVHGGGMIAGTIDLYDPVVRQYVQWTGVPMLAVEYRLAPEARCETPVRDVFAGLEWLVGRAPELGVDPTRIGIMGDSAGGGLAAGAALLARDSGINLARQVLLFPMLDDRNTYPDPSIEHLATWTYDNNYTGWHALLGEDLGTDRVTAYSAPGRNKHFKNLPTTYIEVGTADIFRDEGIAYAQQLLGASVNVELHLYSGYPHGYDWLAFNAPLAQRWKQDRARVIREI